VNFFPLVESKRILPELTLISRPFRVSSVVRLVQHCSSPASDLKAEQGISALNFALRTRRER
jgi:hypothetical protein